LRTLSSWPPCFVKSEETHTQVPYFPPSFFDLERNIPFIFLPARSQLIFVDPPPFFFSGTTLELLLMLLELLIKLLIQMFPLGTFRYHMYVIFILREKFHYIQTVFYQFYFVYLTNFYTSE